MSVWPAKRWSPEKATRINYNWNKVVLQNNVIPELEIVARAQAVYDMGMGIPPAARVIKDSLAGEDVVIIDDHESYGEYGWDDFLLARAIILTESDNLPAWVIKKCWDKKTFRNELYKYVNQMAAYPESRVAYWMDLRVIQAIKLKKSGPEAVLGLTHRILLEMYLAMAE